MEINRTVRIFLEAETIGDRWNMMLSEADRVMVYMLFLDYLLN